MNKSNSHPSDKDVFRIPGMDSGLLYLFLEEKSYFYAKFLASLDIGKEIKDK